MNPDFLVPVIIFFGSLIYATFGFGDALFAMPMLTSIIGIKTATPLMTLNGLTLATFMFIKHYKEIDWKSARRLIFASFIGVPFGIYFLKHGNEQVIKITLGMVIIGASIYNLFYKKSDLHISKRWTLVFGFVAGVLGGAFNTGGPPIAIFGTLRGWTQMQFVSTLQGYFLPSDLFIIICQAIAGLHTTTVFYYYIICLPSLIGAFFLGNWLRKKIPQGKFNRYIFLLLLMVGIVFVLRSI